MSKIDGKTVTDCFALVACFGKEVDSLRDELGNLLSEQLTAEKSTLPCILGGDSYYDDRCDGGNWVYTDLSCCLPLKAKGKGRQSVKKYLGFQISMMGNGMNVPENNEPLLHVFCFDDLIDFEEDFLIGFPLNTVSYADDSYKVIHERLILWGERDSSWSDQEWAYSLRLIDINSIEDLKKYVATPALALLMGEDIRVALPDDWLNKPLIRFPAIL